MPARTSSAPTSKSILSPNFSFLAISPIDRLVEASGATALNNDAPGQRVCRDAHAGRVHAANDPERAYLIFGNNEFGLPPQDTMV